MPQVEAASCGIPVATVNYSAMCDVIKKLEAYPVPIATYFKELETQALRTYPDNDGLIKYIIDFYNRNDKELLSKKIRTLTELHYNWDDISKKWESYLDHLSIAHESKWNDPASTMKKIDSAVVSDMSNIDIIKYIYDEHLNQDISSIDKTALDMLKQADYGFTINGMSIVGYEKKDIVEYFNTIIDNNNQAEYARINHLTFNDDYIQYANIKDRK